MKFLESDWNQLRALTRTWTALDVAARAAAIEHLRPSGQHPASLLEPHLDVLLGLGIVDLSPTGVRVGVNERWKGPIRCLRALFRARVWGAPGDAAIRAYIREHFTRDEIAAMNRDGAHRHSGRFDADALYERVVSEDWPRGFMALPDAGEAVAWESHKALPDDVRHFGRPSVFPTVQRLISELISHPEGVPLSALPALLPEIPVALLEPALHAGLRYLLIYASLDDALEPRVGLWPETALRMSRPAAALARELEPVEVFHAAVTLEDMTTVLTAAASEPMRIRAADGAIFARARRALEDRLVMMPAWFPLLLEEEAEERIEGAHRMLQAFGLARHTGRTDTRLTATENGLAWLGLPPRDRLRHLLDSLRGDTMVLDEWGSAVWTFAPGRWGYVYGKEVAAELRKSFRTLPTDRFIAVEEWLDWQTREANPLLQSEKMRERFRYHGLSQGRGPEWAERLWAAVLTSFLEERLIPLAGASLCLAADGWLGAKLMGPGAYLLGIANDFEYGVPAEAPVVVQPNFEIVFLAPSPLVEAQLARVAERIGTAPGTVFRLTRGGVLEAAAAGTGVDDLLGLLQRSSSQPLPGNVVRQIRDWFGELRRVSMRSVLLIHCEEEETAARVRGALGKAVREIAPTVLEVHSRGTKERAAIVRTLRGKGIFVGS